MKINLAAAMIRVLTIMEKTESMAEAVTSATKKCFPMGNQDEIGKWYDKHTERGNEKCSKC